MSRFWIPSKLILLAAFALPGCYEGMKHPGAGNGPGAGGGKASAADKIYGVTLLDVFRPSREALASPECGNVPPSLVDLRKLEMDARLAALTNLLNAQSVSFRMVATEITPADCNTFLALETRAVVPLSDPDMSDPAAFEKLALHVRLVLWFGDQSRRPVLPAVAANEWADMAHLRGIGITKLLSVNHFVLTAPNDGYVWSWQQSSDPNLNFMATVVTDPLSTDPGLAVIDAAVSSSSAAFAEWLAKRVTGL